MRKYQVIDPKNRKDTVSTTLYLSHSVLTRAG